MKLPINWLEEYTSVSWDVDTLAEKLTLSGNKVEALEKHGDEPVIEIEVTTNRPDTLSILGLAREVSALTGKPVKFPALKKEAAGVLPDKKTVSIDVQDKKGCPLYTARILRNMKVGGTDTATQKKLAAMGSRSVSNAVDITNIVLFETGQPLHAFDLDKLVGGKIIVRRSRAGEKFLGIDGVEHTLDDKTLVIADAEKPVALAGVMGGKATEVTLNTKNILLESAYFDPLAVRQAARKYKTSTDSSYRFERGVDFSGVKTASRRATDLFEKICGAQDTSGLIIKEAQKAPAAKAVTLDLAAMEKRLGFAIAPKKVQNILKALGFMVSGSTKKLKVTPPSFRRDILIEEDLYEEILRIEGFDKAPSLIPTVRHGLEPLIDKKAEKILETKKFLAALGFTEIISYSLLPGRLLEQASPDFLKQAQKVRNPLSADTEIFRPTLLCGALNAAAFNINRKAQSLKFFEVGRVVRNNKEETHLSLFLYGNFEESWKRKDEAGFFELKGAVNALQHFFGTNFSWEASQAPALEPAAALGGESAVAGLISKPVLSRWDIPKDAAYAEINLEAWFEAPVKTKKLSAVPKFPAVRRDLAFLAKRSITVAEIQKSIFETGGELLKQVTLFDEYIGKNIPSDKRSLAFSLEYQKENATFTDEEIHALQSAVTTMLKERYQAELRS